MKIEVINDDYGTYYITEGHVDQQEFRDQIEKQNLATDSDALEWIRTTARVDHDYLVPEKEDDESENELEYRFIDKEEPGAKPVTLIYDEFQ